jgi:hypothetical protein
LHVNNNKIEDIPKKYLKVKNGNNSSLFDLNTNSSTINKIGKMDVLEMQSKEITSNSIEKNINKNKS